MHLTVNNFTLFHEGEIKHPVEIIDSALGCLSLPSSSVNLSESITDQCAKNYLH